MERSYTARTSPGTAPRPGQRLGSPHASEGADSNCFPHTPRKQSSPGVSGLPDPALRSPFADDCQRMGLPLQTRPAAQFACAWHCGSQTGGGSGMRPQAQPGREIQSRKATGPRCLASRVSLGSENRLNDLVVLGRILLRVTGKPDGDQFRAGPQPRRHAYRP